MTPLDPRPDIGGPGDTATEAPVGVGACVACQKPIDSEDETCTAQPCWEATCRAWALTEGITDLRQRETVAARVARVLWEETG